jgi:hypothetical protein
MLQVLPLGLAGAGRVKAVGEWVALTTHLRDFARGSVGSGPIVLFVSSTVFMLFASVRALESRHWR